MQHRVFNRLGHAIERLELEIPPLDSQALGLRQHMRDAANIVRSESGIDDFFVLEQHQGELLEICVGLGFVRKDGHGPVLLLRDNRLIIPVSAFDEPHRDSAPPHPRPVDNLLQIVSTISQIRLQRQPARRRHGKLFLGEDGFEEAQREILQDIAFHVEVDERAKLSCAAEDGTKPGRNFVDGRIGISRMDL